MYSNVHLLCFYEISSRKYDYDIELDTRIYAVQLTYSARLSDVQVRTQETIDLKNEVFRTAATSVELSSELMKLQ